MIKTNYFYKLVTYLLTYIHIQEGHLACKNLAPPFAKVFFVKKSLET